MDPERSTYSEPGAAPHSDAWMRLLGWQGAAPYSDAWMRLLGWQDQIKAEAFAAASSPKISLSSPSVLY
jgi:hypothetical protein